ncbi:MAG TPA: hypothetical protein VF006_34430 [Longimicrobium sp.]
MRTKRSCTLLVFAVASVVGLAAACSDSPSVPPAAVLPPQQQPLRDDLIAYDASGMEYEMDTGEVACPAILNSHVKYWVNINAVGQRLFTFFAPHTRIGYLGGGVYRYRMTLGRSDDNEWLAEGAWTGKCIGYAQWGIGRVLSFEGTVWRVGDDEGDGCGGGGGDWYYMESYDPYSPTPDEDAAVTTSCGGGGGDGFDPANYSCYWDYITLEISYDGGKTWQEFWSGWAQICDEQMA